MMGFGTIFLLFAGGPQSFLRPAAFQSVSSAGVLRPTFLSSTAVEKSSFESSVSDVVTTPIEVEDETQTIANDEEDQSKISSARKVVNDVNEVYRKLVDDVTYSRDYSPTIKFSYVSAPNERDYEKGIIEDMVGQSSHLSIYEVIEKMHNSTKPIALYLPGLDGVGISATQQYDDMSETFELWRMSIDCQDDRSSFAELTVAASNFITDVTGMTKQTPRELILIGESFGGLLAPSVAMRTNAIQSRIMKANGSLNDDELPSSKDGPIKGMVLVNPATSFDETQWSTFAPLLACLRYLETGRDGDESLPTPYSVVGGVTLSAVIPDSTQLRQIVSLLTSAPVATAEDAADILASMRDGFGILENRLPAEVIEHRVARWLPVGTSVVNPRLQSLDVPTLIIAGEDDNMLPTKKEAERLVQVMPNCTSMVIKGSGHFVLDDRVNLTEAILDSPFCKEDKYVKPYDPILDWELPSKEEIKEEIEGTIKTFRTITSPVFISTSETGKRSIGLGQLPKQGDRPILFVANHQFLGLDLGMIIAQLLEERNIMARGLAHPFIFQGGDLATNGGQEGPQSPSTFKKFGAVMVTPRNYYRLMQTNQNGLLFPGGVREVFHGKDEAYQLFWPEKVDFVRTAARFNATIVPLSAVGGADSANIFVDNTDVVNLPFGLGERALNNTNNVIAARFDSDKTDELFQPPIALPKPLAARHYFVFGKPVSTESVDHKNKEECEKLYLQIKNLVQDGLDDTVRAREKDPFLDTARRLAYEQLWGKKAPTFPIEELQ